MSDPQEAATPSDPHSAEALDLDAIEKRADAATPGPWFEQTIRDGYKISYVVEGVSRWRGYTNSIDLGGDGYTASFIAHASTDVPALIAAVRSRDAEVAELKAKIADAVARLHAASIPLGMTESQFDAATIRDTLRILLGSASSPVEGGN